MADIVVSAQYVFTIINLLEAKQLSRSKIWTQVIVFQLQCSFHQSTFYVYYLKFI